MDPTARLQTDAPAPVVVFAYARPDHLRRMIDSLRANPEAPQTDLIVFCDAAKRPEVQPRVDEVRALVASIGGFRSVTPIHRERNLGLAQSIIEGVTRVLQSHPAVIVLEDDLVLSPHCLRYMNDGLQRYRDDDRVASVHAYVYPVDEPLPETFFLRGADCWGWATWSRAWSRFEPEGTTLLARLREGGSLHDFDLDGSYPYSRMLQDQIEGRNDSWAIRWHASCYLAGLLTLYPGRSLVDNIGNDASGTHCGSTSAMEAELSRSEVRVAPIPVEPSASARQAFVRFMRGQQTWKSKARRLLDRVKEMTR